MANPSTVPHNVSVEGGGVDEDFYCSVAGHREGEMEGTLTVR